MDEEGFFSDLNWKREWGRVRSGYEQTLKGKWGESEK
jgi:hypothetical protein